MGLWGLVPRRPPAGCEQEASAPCQVGLALGLSLHPRSVGASLSPSEWPEPEEKENLGVLLMNQAWKLDRHSCHCLSEAQLQGSTIRLAFGRRNSKEFADIFLSHQSERGLYYFLLLFSGQKDLSKQHSYPRVAGSFPGHCTPITGDQ